MSWPDGAKQRARELWADGISAAKIAGLLTGEFGFHLTRSAVIGLMHRLGDQSGRAKDASRHRGTGGQEAARAKRVRRSALRFGGTPYSTAATEAVRRIEVSEAEAVADKAPMDTKAAQRGLLDRQIGECSWPLGDPRSSEFRFCSDPSPREFGSYCKYHQLLSANATAHLVRGKPIEEINRHGEKAEDRKRDRADHGAAIKESVERYSQRGRRGRPRAQGGRLRA